MAAKSGKQMETCNEILADILVSCLDQKLNIFAEKWEALGRTVGLWQTVARLRKLHEVGFRLEPSLGPIVYTREEVEKILSLSISPHGEIFRGYSDD